MIQRPKVCRFKQNPFVFQNETFYNLDLVSLANKPLIARVISRPSTSLILLDFLYFGTNFYAIVNE